MPVLLGDGGWILADMMLLTWKLEPGLILWVIICELPFVRLLLWASFCGSSYVRFRLCVFFCGLCLCPMAGRLTYSTSLTACGEHGMRSTLQINGENLAEHICHQSVASVSVHLGSSIRVSASQCTHYP